MTDELVPRKRSKEGTRSKLSKEQRRMLTEMAAAAYVRMKHGDYKYPEGARKGQVGEDGTRVNKRELMRVAGYSVTGTNTHYERLEEDDYYNSMISLYEKRYTDPLWRDDQINKVWEMVGNEALRNVYERLTLYPHELTVEQLLKILKTVIDAGISMSKIGKDEGKTSKLIDSIKDPEQRLEVKEEYKRKLRKELEKLE